MSAARIAKEAIKIPLRIERGPTDILKALSSTVKFIPSEPEPFLQDDPYLLPQRQNDKRYFALSYLSGKRTAKFIMNKKPELFFRDDAEPKIAAFSPMEQYQGDMEFTEEDLIWCLENNDLENGIIAYNSLKENRKKLADETMIKLLEQLCFSNEEQEHDEFELEQDRFLPNSEKQLVNQSWKTSGLAVKVFEEFKDKLDGPRAYSAMIAGLSKYNEHTAARSLFNEFIEKFPDSGLYTHAYAGLIYSVPNLNSSVDTAYRAVDEIVQHMENNLVKPDLKMFNNILKCYRQFTCDSNTCLKSLKLINDMKTLNIEPSLGTMGYLIAILTRFRHGQAYTNVIGDILTYVEESVDLTKVRDQADLLFLSMVMTIFAVHLNNLKFAKRLHKIYMKNPKMFKDHRFRQKFLNDYFKLIITADSIDNTLQFYEDYVPMQLQPNSDAYDALVEALDLYQVDENTVKKIGQDVIKFRQAKYIKNDSIFRKDPNYVEALELSIG